MSVPALILTVVYVLLGIALIAAVMFQSGKSDGLSGMTNGGDTFLARNRARSLDARLAKATKWLAIALVVLTLIVGLVVG